MAGQTHLTFLKLIYFLKIGKSRSELGNKRIKHSSAYFLWKFKKNKRSLTSTHTTWLMIVLELNEAKYQQSYLNRTKAWLKMWKILSLCGWWMSVSFSKLLKCEVTLAVNTSRKNCTLAEKEKFKSKGLYVQPNTFEAMKRVEMKMK